MITLAHPECLLIDGRWTGGSQEWYKKFWHRQSGCGPTTAALMAWYLAQTRPEYAALCDVGTRSRADFVCVMDGMFGYVTPGLRGVNTAAKFISGVENYAQARGIALTLAELELEQIPSALQNDLPVAFLNLHSGSQSQLDSWHWMTVVAFDPDSSLTHCCDQGKIVKFSLRQWHKTSKLGGHFATIHQK